MPPSKIEKLFGAYIAKQTVLIADTGSAARAGLANILINMGAKTGLVHLAPSYETALAELEKTPHQVVFADYELGSRCGLELLQTFREKSPEANKSLFVLVTGNTSQSAVAQAAEEDVDVYILKPYTQEVLRQTIMRASVAKLYPSEYAKEIEEGKTLMGKGEIDQAQEHFKKATSLDAKPSLALGYMGQTDFMKEIMETSESNYKKGLSFNKIHYKCLVGLFDLLMKKKDFEEAYDLVKKISRYFPANPQRLTTVLRLAIMTKSYEDIERYYQVFTNLDQRDGELIKYICAALVVCGKFYLQQGAKARGMELFQKASVSGAGRTKILKEIILALAQHNLFKDSEKFLARFPQDTHQGEDYKVCSYVVASGTAADSAVIEMGRKLVKEGISDPLIYRILIESSAKAGLSDSAEDYAGKAGGLWPNQKEEFLKLAQMGKAATPAKAVSS